MPRTASKYQWVVRGDPPHRTRMKLMSILERAAAIAAVQLEVAEGRMSLAEAVKRLRLDVTGLSQRAFATLFKISALTLSRIESGRVSPPAEVLDRIFRAFGMSLSLEMNNQLSKSDQLIARLEQRRNRGGWRPDEYKAPGDIDVVSMDLEQALLPFLQFLAKDIEANPQRLVTVSNSLRARAQALIDGMEVELGVRLPSEANQDEANQE